MGRFFEFSVKLDFFILEISFSGSDRESCYGVRSEGTAKQTIDILTVMNPAALLSAARRVSTEAAAHEAFAEVVCQGELGPAISPVI